MGGAASVPEKIEAGAAPAAPVTGLLSRLTTAIGLGKQEEPSGKQPPAISEPSGTQPSVSTQNGGRRCRRKNRKLTRRSTLRKTKQIRRSLRNK